MTTLTQRTTRLALAALIAVGATLAHAQTLRPEVGKPLQQASDLLRAGKGREALAAVAKADKVKNKTSAEQLMIERMRGSAAQRAGDNAMAVRSFEPLMASGTLSNAEEAQMAESMAYAYSQLQNWPKSLQYAQKAQAGGRNSPQLNQLVAYVQAQSGDYSAVAKQAAASVAAAEKAGRKPAEDDLLRLSDAYQRTKNPAGQSAVLEKLLTYYPKKDYWAVALGRLPFKPGYSSRYDVDLLRLKYLTGNLTTANEYMELAQLMLQNGQASEAVQIVDKGMADGVLGTGADAARHRRLRDLAAKQKADEEKTLAQREKDAQGARDGNELVQVGSILAGLGQVDKGVSLIEAGIAKGNLKRPEDAKLQLGIAQLKSPKMKAAARKTLRSVKGDGTSDVARLYALAGES